MSIMLILFTACGSEPAEPVPQAVVIDSLPALPGAVETPSVETPTVESPEDTVEAEVKDLPETKTFTVEAKRFEFIPGTIEVNEGDTVILKATSTDTDHGISISEFGVNANMPVGETVEITFVADKKGEYPIVCSVFCGGGHKGMTGTLIVN